MCLASKQNIWQHVDHRQPPAVRMPLVFPPALQAPAMTAALVEDGAAAPATTAALVEDGAAAPATHAARAVAAAVAAPCTNS